jgi:O-antigen/teichoic acid export membrane protein
MYHQGELANFKQALHKIYGMLLAMCVIVILGAALLGRWGLSLLFGKDILTYYDLFMPIVYCTLCTGIVWILSAVVILLRRIKALLMGIVIDFVICVVLAFPMIRNMGANGVSSVQIVALLLYIIFMVIICEQTINKETRKSE